MTHYPYLIIGGGMAAAAAVRGIREVDTHSAIGLIGEEGERPYNRPPLSKGLWKGDTVDSIWSEMDGNGVSLHLGCAVATVDPANKRVIDTRGTVYTFEQLLLATGGTPRRLTGDDDQVVYFHTLDDYRRLRALADQRRRFAVIGGGFIASEIAAALRMQGKEVTMLLPEDTIGHRLFPQDLAQHVTTYYREQGVNVHTGDRVAGIERRGEQHAVITRGGHEIVVDGVVAGIGIEPNIALAREAGLAVGNGILVDSFLRTSHRNIFAAGDVAEFPDHTLGGRRRVEHEDNANAMGWLAGRCMAGEPAPYHHLPSFYSDLFELGYEAVGELDSRLDTVADWTEPYRTGVVYYLREGRLRGVLLWNVWEQVDAARRLLAERRLFQPTDLIGRLPQASVTAGGTAGR
jgi:3-phenylpropionate/trans-cinnamate dioxygenase ferredoxin reductase subunit